jgi:tetratricopeptide (TPR) repeat protein
MDLDPNHAQSHYRLGLVQLQQHRPREAVASIQRAIDLGVFYPWAAGALASAYAASGDRAAALKIVRDLEQRSGHELVPPVTIAWAYAGLGDVTHAFDWLNRGLDEHDIYIPENFFDPLLDPVRNDPRYEQVVKRMGLGPPAP